MSDEFIALSDCFLTKRHAETRIAFHEKQYIHAETFYGTVSYWVTHLQSQPFQRYALYTNDAYPFTVLLIALFHAGKEVWIAGNNRPGTAKQLQQHGCQLIGDWGSHQSSDYHLTSINSSAPLLSPLNAIETKLVIFTSGSTGEPKLIEKRLSQLQVEIDALEQLWGKQLGEAEALSTVSHQHIYGLLFRILWPLSAGRCFHSSIYLNPEILVNNVNNNAAYWVASPAHLKRFDQYSPWQAIAGMKAIFSSGAALHQPDKQQIRMLSRQHVTEIYGSSETGGIGWRQQDVAWTLFPGMDLKKVDKSWYLSSPYFPDKAYCLLDDQLSMLDDGRFILNGRSDRIVKIEEKRVSLAELEQRLKATSLIEEAFMVVISKKRDMISAVVVLTQEGLAYQSIKGRSGLIKQLRKELELWFEPVVLPRKWLLVNHLPLTTQGKIDQPLLKSLLESDRQKLPQPLSITIKADSVQLELIVPQVQGSIYFPGHFPDFPILPGVVQLAWVEHFGKLFFNLSIPILFFSHLEVVKFIKIIRPGDELMLTLKWKALSGELSFNFSSVSGRCSSGRMVYKLGEPRQSVVIGTIDAKQ
jgi:acyl-coenzyme A synthetase/AMP-(fatty) acid ligase